MLKRLFVPALAISALLAFLPSALAQSSHPAAPAPHSVSSLTLQGVVRGAQNQTYVKVPFRVPAGTERVTITFAYTEREQHTALDLGLLDPSGLRCWSGGNKPLLTVGISDATPSCLPGPIPTGTWNVLIGVPNIRPAVVSHYTIHVDFTPTGAVAQYPAELRAPLRDGPAWYRGDLHMHTGHSDGACPSLSGKLVPCPVFVTVQAAGRLQVHVDAPPESLQPAEWQSIPRALQQIGMPFRSAALTGDAVELALDAAELTPRPLIVAGVLGNTEVPPVAEDRIGEELIEVEPSAEPTEADLRLVESILLRR